MTRLQINASECPPYRGYAEISIIGGTADDIVVHEWAHGYTWSTHDLGFLGQSGALNESYSDIFGEVVDQYHAGGTDVPATVRTVETCSEHDDNGVTDGTDEDSYLWLLGEDGDKPLRDMWHPNCLGHPGKTSDAEYACVGGAHINNGVPNHAFALLVDGGTYNGETVASIGVSEASFIYWRAQRVYQGPSTGFADHADALVAACEDLISVTLRTVKNCVDGPVIAASDCDAVEAAMRAVEMCSPVCVDCPATSSCLGPANHCGDVGAQLSDVVVVAPANHCKLPDDSILECGVGNHVHKITSACDKDACCDEFPPCICAQSCGFNVVLDCQAALPLTGQLCLAYPDP